MKWKVNKDGMSRGSEAVNQMAFTTKKYKSQYE